MIIHQNLISSKCFLWDIQDQIRFYSYLKLIHKAFAAVFSQVLSSLIEKRKHWVSTLSSTCVKNSNVLKHFYFTMHSRLCGILVVQLCCTGTTCQDPWLNSTFKSVYFPSRAYLVKPIMCDTDLFYFILYSCLENTLLSSLFLNGSLYNLLFHFTVWGPTRLTRRLEMRLHKKEE